MVDWKLEFIFGLKLFFFGVLTYFAGVWASSPVIFDKGIFVAFLSMFMEVFTSKYLLILLAPLLLALVLFKYIPKASLWILTIALFVFISPATFAFMTGFHVYGVWFFVVSFGFLIAEFAISFLISLITFLLGDLIKFELKKHNINSDIL